MDRQMGGSIDPRIAGWMNRELDEVCTGSWALTDEDKVDCTAR